MDTSIKIDKDLKNRIKLRAARTKSTIKQIVEDALEKLLEDEQQ